MEIQQEFIVMEDRMKRELKGRYQAELASNMLNLTVRMLFAGFCMVSIIDYNFYSDDGNGSLSQAILYTALAFLFITVYVMLYRRYAKHNLPYLRDAQLGYIIRERVRICALETTPIGYCIYRLDHPVVTVLVPEPYRPFRKGDWVSIYYLKHSGEYLGYDPG